MEPLYEALKPKDSTHIATAIIAKVDILNTFDDDLIKLSEQIGSPPLIIQRPFFSHQLELF